MKKRTAPRVHPAWGMLALVLLGLLAAQGTRIAFGAFVPAWREGLHAGLGTISLIGLVSYLVYGFTQPLVGQLAGRFGPRTVLSGGIFVAGAGLLLSSAASSVPGLLGLYGILATLGFSAASGVTAGLVVRHWFTERRGLAFGLVESGFGAGQFVFTPLSLFLIEAYGWRTTLVIEGILLVAAVGPLVGLLLRSAPGDSGPGPYGGPDPADRAGATPGRAGIRVREVLGSPLMWGLLAPFFVCGVTTTGLMDTHLVSIAHDHGASTALTGTAVGLLAAANIAGTVMSGPLSDRYHCARILALLYGTRALVLILLALAPYGVWLVVLSVAFGLVDFATVAPTHLIATRHFPVESLGLIFGLLSMAHQLGASLGSYLPGVLHDLTGSYTPTLLGCSAALLVAMIGCLVVLPGTPATSGSDATGVTEPRSLTTDAA
ncbi:MULTISPECIES: MFS transporter [Streptomyces]|uniref:MFS family permease n=1 Tax=Streptomyces demainii TaxID=588122 RepID=A0ABT9L5Z0_9ACTN|nr:MFS transporter [Streptomyces demainii]MDP9616103.1 MFS family permease [Streptomyces demainii]